MNTRQLEKKMDIHVVVSTRRSDRLEAIAAFTDEKLAKEYRSSHFSRHMLDNIEINLFVLKCGLYEEEKEEET